MSAQQAALPGPGADPSEKRAHRALGPRLDALPDAPSRPLGPRGHNIAWNSKRSSDSHYGTFYKTRLSREDRQLHRKWQESLENGSVRM